MSRSQKFALKFRGWCHKRNSALHFLKQTTSQILTLQKNNSEMFEEKTANANPFGFAQALQSTSTIFHALPCVGIECMKNDLCSHKNIGWWCICQLVLADNVKPVPLHILQTRWWLLISSTVCLSGDYLSSTDVPFQVLLPTCCVAKGGNMLSKFERDLWFSEKSWKNLNEKIWIKKLENLLFICPVCPILLFQIPILCTERFDKVAFESRRGAPGTTLA